MSEVPHYLTHISNYSGLFVTGKSYDKFDFVYNTGDSRFYYAKQDLTYGAGLSVTSANRFSLDKDGPTFHSSQGSESYYLYDEYNRLGDVIGEDYEVGQTISIVGSTGSNDGSYKILEINEIDQLGFDGDNVTGTITGTLDAIESDDAANWFNSSWFFRAPSIDGAWSWWNGQSYSDYVDYYPDLFAQFEEKASTDTRNKAEWGKDHYNTLGKSEGRIVPETNRYLSNSELGWMYISPSHETNQELWFAIDTNVETLWFWASSGTLGPSAVGAQNYTFLGNSGEGSMGPTGWVSWARFSGPGLRGTINVYNHDEDQWYEFKGDGSNSEPATSSPIDSPGSAPSPISSDQDSSKKTENPDKAKRKRLWLAPVGVSSIDTDEPASSNSLTISAIDADPSSDPDSWSADLFYFDADYGSTVNFKANNDRFKYGNGYYILQPKSINSLNVEFNLDFKSRTNKEANAIIHFLENHQGQHEEDRPSSNLKYSQGISGFRWDGNSTFHPYDSVENQTKKFLCSEFSHSLNFENSNDLKVKLRNLDTSLLNKSEQLYVNKAPTYSDSSTYQKNDVVFYTGNHQYYYWHSSASASSKPPAEPNPRWDAASGYFTDLNTEYWTRDFFWKPSIGLNISQNPRLLTQDAGGAYTQMYNDGINESMLKLNLQFKNRSDEEAYSILHFLESHCGYLPFSFNPPAPYERTKNFVCEEWSHQYIHKDSHTISATFEQYPFNFSAEQYTDMVPPPELSSGQLIFTNPLSFAQRGDENSITTGQAVRARMRFKNIGDSPVDIYSGAISGRVEDADYFFHGQTGNNNIPLISDSLSYDKYVVQIPASVTIPFDLGGKYIRISKNYSDGAIGGHYFNVVNSDGTNVIVDGHRDIYFQNNKGEIVSGIEAVSTSPTACSYFVNQPLFASGNSMDSLAGGEEGYADVIFSGASAAGVTDHLVSGGIHGEDFLEAYEGGSYYNIILESTDIYYYGDVTIFSSEEFSPQSGELRTYVSSRD